MPIASATRDCEVIDRATRCGGARRATDEMKMASPPKAVAANRRQWHRMAGAGKQRPSRCFMCAARLFLLIADRDRRSDCTAYRYLACRVDGKVQYSHARGSSQSAKPGKDPAELHNPGPRKVLNYLTNGASPEKLILGYGNATKYLFSGRTLQDIRNAVPGHSASRSPWKHTPYQGKPGITGLDNSHDITYIINKRVRGELLRIGGRLPIPEAPCRKSPIVY